jgi:hypothetical protein
MDVVTGSRDCPTNTPIELKHTLQLKNGTVELKDSENKNHVSSVGKGKICRVRINSSTYMYK